MKMMKLIYPLALAAAVTLAGAGCKHAAPRTTPLPGVTAPPAAPSGGDTQTPGQNPGLPPAPSINNGEGGVNANNQTPPSFQNTNAIAEQDGWPANMAEDRAALAANTVHFAFDSAVVKSAEEANVEAVAGYLNSNPSDYLMIEGNCDERGTEEYNRSLGERRALALREDLAKLKVDPKRVHTISYGKDKPVDPGHDEAAFAKNRRGDFVIYHPKTGV